jgi:hypothetical protein
MAAIEYTVGTDVRLIQIAAATSRNIERLIFVKSITVGRSARKKIMTLGLPKVSVRLARKSFGPLCGGKALPSPTVSIGAVQNR